VVECTFVAEPGLLASGWRPTDGCRPFGAVQLQECRRPPWWRNRLSGCRHPPRPINSGSAPKPPAPIGARSRPGRSSNTKSG